jgi:DNA-3-methyladenine glycosylase
MEARRHTMDRMSLCSGPGKLVRAMGITRFMNGIALTDKGVEETPLYLEPATNQDFEMVTTTRIGISQGVDLPYRFYVKGNPYISRK